MGLVAVGLPLPARRGGIEVGRALTGPLEVRRVAATSAVVGAAGTGIDLAAIS